MLEHRGLARAKNTINVGLLPLDGRRDTDLFLLQCALPPEELLTAIQPRQRVFFPIKGQELQAVELWWSAIVSSLHGGFGHSIDEAFFGGKLPDA